MNYSVGDFAYGYMIIVFILLRNCDPEPIEHVSDITLLEIPRETRTIQCLSFDDRNMICLNFFQ